MIHTKVVRKNSICQRVGTCGTLKGTCPRIADCTPEPEL